MDPMRGILTVTVLAATLTMALAAPAWAKHVSASPSASARLGEQIADSSWSVIVDWAVNCSGAGEDPVYSGSLQLVDADTGERMPLGGISHASGISSQAVELRDTPRTVYPELTAACAESEPPRHGSGSRTITGPGVTVPAKAPPPPDDGGGAGTNPDVRPGGPADPLAAGGCAVELRGTDATEMLAGTVVGDLIYGLAGADVIRGSGGHDCLVGGPGADDLFGGTGSDRLTGGTGSDYLSGGSGVDLLDAGPGGDVVNARDRRREIVRCGTGIDRAVVDRRDRVRGCERVSRR